ncbi:MAG: 3-dehydro-L-gulonate 2-dehydrogenase [Candidatus Ventricola sp.]|nr:3-dehydro-L-gulonate 2-dehydrogenase [Candidatus Ventricola sp.]
MIYVQYEEAVKRMARGLERFLNAQDAKRFAEIFAGNSLDGVYSHGMNRYPRYLSDMESGLCDAKVTQAERVSGLGGLEVWDAHFGVGPLIAQQMAERAIELARTHGIACVALRNNSHWLRAGRYGLMMADAGMMGLCMTNTCMNLVAYGAKEPSTGNNPITIAIPRRAGSLVMDMAVSQYAFGKLEIMAQEGGMLDTPCGYDTDGNLTNDPQKIVESGLMTPMALWKGSALSIMIDLMVSMLSLGRTSLAIGTPADGEKGMSQMFVCMNPAAVIDMDKAEAQMEKTIAFLNGLEPKDGVHGVHAPGENLERTRARNRERGIPVTEDTWQKIVNASE